MHLALPVAIPPAESARPRHVNMTVIKGVLVLLEARCVLYFGPTKMPYAVPPVKASANAV